MVSDTRYVPKAKNKMDDDNPKKKISKRTEVGNYNSDMSSLRRLSKELSLSRHSTPNPPTITKSEQHLENEKRKKETKEKNVIQPLMESEKAEIRLEFNSKRKKMTAHTYKAQFKAQCMRTVVSDTDEVIEGPNELAMDIVVDGPPDSVDSEYSTSLPSSRDGTVHSETGEKCRDPKDINGVMVGSKILSVPVMDNVVNQPSDVDCLKESCASLSVNKLHTNSSRVKNLNSLEKEASTCSGRLQDGVVSESGEKCMHPEGTEATLFPESVNDSLPAICNVCFERKRVNSCSTENYLCSCGGAVNKDQCRLSTCLKRVQYSNESPSEPNTDNTDVGNKRRKVVNENMDPESVQVELNRHQATQGADRERGPSIIATCNQSQSLQMNGVTATSNLNSKQTSSGEISLSDEQNSLYSSLLEELMKLCYILKLSEDATRMGRRFLEYVIKNHHVSSDTPAIVQAFQISLCWIAASIAKQMVDKKDSLILAKQHLNYQCTKVNVQSVYSKMRTLKRMYLSEQDLNREPFNEWSAKLVGVKKEIGVKSPNEEHGRSEIDIKISEIEKKCRKRQKKLQRKQQEKIQEFHKIWNEKRTQLEDDHRLETAFIRSLHSEGSVRTDKLKHLNEACARNIEDHNLLKSVELKNLEAEQLAAMNEEKQKAERWLTAAKACYSEPIAVNSPTLLESRSTYNVGVSQLAIRTVDATGVVTESTLQLADQNPGDIESTRHSVGQNPSENELTRHLEDQNPSESGPTQHIENQNTSESESTQHFEVQNPGESVCAHGNASTIATISISASDKAAHCDISTETRDWVDNDSQNEVVVKDVDMSSMKVVKQPNQSKHLCDNRELVCSELGAGDQSINLTTEPPVEVPETAPNENARPSFQPQGHYDLGTGPTHQSHPSGPLASERSHYSQRPLQVVEASGSRLKNIPGVPLHSADLPQDACSHIGLLPEPDGRHQTKPSDEILEYSRRPIVKVMKGLKTFNNEKTKTDISGLLRQHYKGEFYWKDVSMDQRQLLWEQFGRRYRWNRDEEANILKVWSWINQDRFSRMLQEAKTLWNKGNGRKAKWMLPHHWRNLVGNHWTTREQVAVAERCRANRGENATYFGGTRSALRYQQLLDGPSDREPHAPSPTILKAIKSKVGAKFLRALMGKRKKNATADVAPEEKEVVPAKPDEITEEWRWLRYNEILAEKYRDNPEEMPGPHDEVDVVAWAEANGGPYHGRIWALGNSINIPEHGLSGSQTSQTQSQVDDEPLADRVMGNVTDVIRDYPGLDKDQTRDLIARIQAAEKQRRYDTGRRRR